ncbi:MAG: GxxExxY protein [Flavobacteriales bacterium]|nr:GxxExxY protein [Flavobacteriales bacterium]
MEINQITGTIIEEAIRIHREVGPGLLESVYEAVLAKRLTNRGLKVQCQVPVPVVIDGEDFPVGFRMDMLVEGIVIVELKSVEDVPAVDYKRVQTYLRLQDLRIALLINFGRETLLEGLSRIANKYIEDRT